MADGVRGNFRGLNGEQYMRPDPLQGCRDSGSGKILLDDRARVYREEDADLYVRSKPWKSEP